MNMSLMNILGRTLPLGVLLLVSSGAAATEGKDLDCSASLTSTTCPFAETFSEAEVKFKGYCFVSDGQGIANMKMPTSMDCTPSSNATCAAIGKDNGGPNMYCDCSLSDTSQSGKVSVTVSCP